MATAQGVVNSRQKVSDRISHHNLTPTLAVKHSQISSSPWIDDAMIPFSFPTNSTFGLQGSRPLSSRIGNRSDTGGNAGEILARARTADNDCSHARGTSTLLLLYFVMLF